MAELRHYQEFKEVLKKYHISEHAQEIINDLKLVLLLAPSSSGRNTIIRHQVETGRYNYVISDTTRSPRKNDGIMEENGREYWFKTEEEMLADLKSGEYLEAEIIHGQQVSGIGIKELQKASQQGKIAITDIELLGMHNVVRSKPDTVAIMLLPPNFEEWQRRLAGRGTMRPDELKRRMQTAQKILEDGLREDYYHYVISEDIDQSGAIIDAIVDGKSNPHQGRGRSLIEHLQNSLQDKLGTMF